MVSGEGVLGQPPPHPHRGAGFVCRRRGRALGAEPRGAPGSGGRWWSQGAAGSGAGVPPAARRLRPGGSGGVPGRPGGSSPLRRRLERSFPRGAVPRGARGAETSGSFVGGGGGDRAGGAGSMGDCPPGEPSARRGGSLRGHCPAGPAPEGHYYPPSWPLNNGAGGCFLLLFFCLRA